MLKAFAFAMDATRQCGLEVFRRRCAALQRHLAGLQEDRAVWHVSQITRAIPKMCHEKDEEPKPALLFR